MVKINTKKNPRTGSSGGQPKLQELGRTAAVIAVAAVEGEPGDYINPAVLGSSLDPMVPDGKMDDGRTVETPAAADGNPTAACDRTGTEAGHESTTADAMTGTEARGESPSAGNMTGTEAGVESTAAGTMTGSEAGGKSIGSGAEKTNRGRGRVHCCRGQDTNRGECPVS